MEAMPYCWNCCILKIILSCPHTHVRNDVAKSGDGCFTQRCHVQQGYARAPVQNCSC
eukprot:jgi/Antlo1/188/316